MIYVISDGMGHIKVGKSRDPESRLRALQTGHANELRLIFCIDMPDWEEAFFHDLLSEDHIRGEWFHDTERARKNLNIHGKLFVPVLESA